MVVLAVGASMPSVLFIGERGLGSQDERLQR